MEDRKAVRDVNDPVEMEEAETAARDCAEAMIKMQDNDNYRQVLEKFTETQDFLEDVECRMFVSGVVSDAVMSGVCNAVLEESKEELFAKDSNIRELNTKLQNLDEVLRTNDEQLSNCISDRDRLIAENQRMQQMLQAAEEKLELAHVKMLETVERLKTAERKNSDMSKEIDKLKEVEISNSLQISALLEEGRTIEAENEEIKQSLFKERSDHSKNDRLLCQLQNLVEEKDGTILRLQEQNLSHLDNLKILRGQMQAETERQRIKEEIEGQVLLSCSESQVGELRNRIETERKDFEQKFQTSKSELESKIMSMHMEIKRLEDGDVSSKMEVLFTAGILETSFQDFGDQMSHLREQLCLKNDSINSLTVELGCIRQEWEMLRGQISSTNIMDKECENNLNTWHATMERQCTEAKQELDEQKHKIKEDLLRVSTLEEMNSILTERSRIHSISLKHLKEKLLEQDWQHENECQIASLLLRSKLTEITEQIAQMCSALERKEMEISSHLQNVSSMQVVLNDRRIGVSRIQEMLEFFESQIGTLITINIRKLDSSFCHLNAKFLSAITKLENFGERFRAYFENIQKNASSVQEEHFEHQCKEGLEGQICAVVLDHFFTDLQNWIKSIDNESSLHETGFGDESVALLNELRSLQEELEIMKSEDQIKSHLSYDGANSKGFHYFSQLDGQHKGSRSVRWHSAAQLSFDTSKSDDVHKTCPGGKDAEVHPTRDHDLCEVSILEAADISESPLKSLSKEQIVGYFKKLIAGLRRDHEAELQKMTEDIYSLKGELLNQKDSFHSKRDRELNALKKKVAEVAKKLSKVVDENNRFSSSADQGLKYKILYNLREESEAERNRLLEKMKEKNYKLKTLSDELSDALSNITGLASRKAEFEIETLINVDILSVSFEAAIKERECLLSASSNERNVTMDQCSVLAKMLNEKHECLNIMSLENEELKKQIRLLETLVQENENTSNTKSCQAEERDQNEEHKRLLESALMECEDLKSDIQDKHANIDELIKEQEELNNQLALMQAEMKSNKNSLIETLNEEKEKVLSLESRNSELKKLNEEQQELILKLQQELEHLKIQVLSTMEKVKKEENARMTLSRKFEDLFIEKKSLEKSIQDKEKLLNKQHACLMKEMENKEILLMEKLTKVNEKLLSLEARHLAIMSQNEKQKMSLVNLREKTKDYSKQVLSTKEALQKNEALRTGLSRDLKEACREKDSLKRNVKDKEEMLKEKIEQEEQLKQQLKMSIAQQEISSKLAAKDLKECQEKIMFLEESLKEKDFSLGLLEKSTHEDEVQKHVMEEASRLLKHVIQNAQELESSVLEKIQEHTSRLRNGTQQLRKIYEQKDEALLRELSCRKKLERMYHNLQKAEEEVDLLGDEVDALLNLIRKIYLALDHYLPVLQHYPGILDLLKLIRKELWENFHLEIHC